MRSMASRSDFVLPQQKKRRAPKMRALTAAIAMPTMVPVLNAPDEVCAGGDVGADVDLDDEEGITEDAGLPEERGDSTGNGSPRRMSAKPSEFATR